MTRDYYHVEIENGVYDFLHRLSSPLEVPDGCYISWQDSEDRRWHQKKPDGSFITARSTIDSTKNPRDDRDNTFGEDEEHERHDLPTILKSYHSRKKKSQK